MNEKIKKILLVESNHYLSMALMVALSTGLVDRAVLNVSRSCYQALYAVKTQPVDLVIVNNQLPCMSGPELISEIHKINPNIPAIVISEFETDHLPSRNGHINYDDLSKPYGLAKIYETVTSALQLDASNGKHIPKLSSEGKAKIKAKILIMDDDFGLLRIYKKALSRKNFQVFEAYSLREAQNLIENNTFDIFVCDIQVGRERGTDLLEKMKDKLMADNTQTILCSSYNQYRFMSEDLGVNFFLEKPISLGTLITLIERLVSNYDLSTAYEQ